MARITTESKTVMTTFSEPPTAAFDGSATAVKEETDTTDLKPSITYRQRRHILTLLAFSIITSIFSDTAYLPILAIFQPTFCLAYCHVCHCHPEIDWCKKYVFGALFLSLFRAIPASDYFFFDVSRPQAYVSVLAIIIVLYGLVMAIGVMQSSIWIDSKQYYSGDVVEGDACGDLHLGSGSGEYTPLLPSNSASFSSSSLSKQRHFLFSPYVSPLAFPILLTSLYQLLFQFSSIGGAANPAMGLAQVSGLRQVVSLFGEIYLVFWIGWLASIVGGVGFILGEGGWLDNSIETLVDFLCSFRNNQDYRRRGGQPVRREMNHIAKCHAYTFGFTTLFMLLYGSARELVGRGIYLQNIETWSATHAGPLQVSCITGSGDLQSMIDRTNERLASGDDLIMWSEVAGGYSEVFPDLFEWNLENTGAAVVSAYQAPVVGNTVEAYNAMTIMQNGKELSTYYKNRPVPLVEPNILPGPTRPNVTSVTFTPKSSSSTGRHPVSLKTSMAICFDFDFSYLFRDASTADIVLGASWYWASIGFMFWEHNIFRAIENGFTIIKCAQGGITGAVDPYGRVLAAVPTSDNEVHLMEVPVQNGVFTLFRAWGWVFGWVCVFLSPVVLVVFVWDKIRQK